MSSSLQAIERRSVWQRRIPRPESGRGSRVRGQENDRPTQLRMSSRRRAIASIAGCPAPWSITSNGATSALPPAAVISSGHRLRLTLPAVQHDGGAFGGECLRYGPAARGAGHQRDPGVQGNESVMLLPVLKWQRVIPDTLLPPSAWRPRAAPMASITSARKWFPECKRGDLHELALPFEH
jgi:hypothetical protein